jgi:hypothetical protein
VGSCRSELLDHVIVLNEWHVKRLLSEYVSYYHEDRTHLGILDWEREHRSVELAARPLVACSPMID